VAEAMVREIGRVSLEEALELTVAVKEPHRYERVATRWLRLYLDERAVSLDDVVFCRGVPEATQRATPSRGARRVTSCCRLTTSSAA
jgi:hypothetical protein